MLQQKITKKNYSEEKNKTMMLTNKNEMWFAIVHDAIAYFST